MTYIRYLSAVTFNIFLILLLVLALFLTIYLISVVKNTGKIHTEYLCVCVCVRACVCAYMHECVCGPLMFLDYWLMIITTFPYLYSSGV